MVEVCRIEGVCLECADLETCPVLRVYTKVAESFKTFSCMGFRRATPLEGKDICLVRAPA